MNEAAADANDLDVFCPSCGSTFSSTAPYCPRCRRCPSCGAQALESPLVCPSCGHPADEQRLARVRKTLDPRAAENQRLLKKVRVQQKNRELMSRLSVLKMLVLLLIPFLLLQIVAAGVAAVTPIHYQWLAGLSFIIVVPGGVSLALSQLRRGRWQWLLKST